MLEGYLPGTVGRQRVAIKLSRVHTQHQWGALACLAGGGEVGRRAGRQVEGREPVEGGERVEGGGLVKGQRAGGGKEAGERRGQGVGIE